MAGIGFELRKLFHKEGLINNIRAYAYSSLTTVGPMILCMALIMVLQLLMSRNGGSYLDWELYIATMSYCFIFSIVVTSGVSMTLTRYVADMMYQKKYERLMSSYYGVLLLMLPLCSIISISFLWGVEGDFFYKLAAYFCFMFLVIIWIQGVYLSALKDYMRITRSFIIGAILAVAVGWVLLKFSSLSTVISALTGIDVGFFIIILLSSIHFEQKFPRGSAEYYFEFLQYFKKFASLFFAGCFVYSGVYLHNFVYWFSNKGTVIADQFHVYMFYDVPVFYAFLSVMPTLVTFVVSVETSFYEKFRVYYLNVLEGGTIQDIKLAKKQMQKTLTREISFLMEIQLLFTVLSIALGIKFLPYIGFTMEQLDLFIILALAYFLFITVFVFTHVLMYFDDRKGVMWIGLLFFVLNIGCTYWMMQIGYDGLGIFIAAFVAIIAVIARLLYVLRNIDYYTFCSQPMSQISAKKALSIQKKGGIALSVIMIVAIMLTGCSVTDSLTASSGKTVNEIINEVTIPTDLSTELIEDKGVYERDDDSSLKTLYVTVLPYKEHDGSFNWYAMNRQTDKATAKELDVIVQEGRSDDKGPLSGMFGFADMDSNATIELRGNTTWYLEQKSFKIKFKSDTGTYMDQRTLNLNKHVDDFSRIRNKLSFDLMETLPDMTSLRTQFIHVYIKDLSNNEKTGQYVDYGLFTHIEQPNKQFLKAHLLDPNGYLYKATNFEFFLNEELKDIDDAKYDLDAFNTILEVKGREEHTRLIEMLTDVNDFTIPIDEVIEKHFNEDNFLTWTAMNLLMDNLDTMTQNYYLYSPLNSTTWYFLPWDYDDAYRNFNSRLPFQQGISIYWGNVLASRYFRSEKNVEKLTEKMEELYNYINEDSIQQQIDKYYNIVYPFLHRNPDKNFLSDPIALYDQELELLKTTPKTNLANYYEDLQKPKPFYLNEVEIVNNKLKFSWELSFDLQDDELTYSIQIANDMKFTEIVKEENMIKGTTFTMEKLSPGRYYFKVLVTDSQGNVQYPFDSITVSSKEYYAGLREFEVK
ncbi:exopolysaccharide Pel transporter PelG [Paenibacillus endoradicis]|uniref:exopolysaccharide Pel transporter PelG n=1 Tax=Paenibacillus endoradicis TaxID=2972487 RepID=UPI002158F179|nr:exopolysaccharide Pel transporter PelG [Paenibacillus endoradicis]MCR8657587.1 exopolysaccharide Pel transporter PelG [Paenibacillus endoradicis]